VVPLKIGKGTGTVHNGLVVQCPLSSVYWLLKWLLCVACDT